MTSFKNMLRAAALGVAMIATAAAVPNQASAADRSDVIAGVAGGLLLGTLFAAAANANNNSYAAPVQTYQAPRQTYIAPAQTYAVPVQAEAYYAPAPTYYAPPVSFSFGFNRGHRFGHRHFSHRRHFRRHFGYGHRHLHRGYRY